MAGVESVLVDNSVGVDEELERVCWVVRYQGLCEVRFEIFWGRANVQGG